jgi:HEAT repeat protein
MKRESWRAWVATLTVIFLARCAGGQSNPYGFSSKAVESIPDIVQRANSPDLNDRIGVLDQLMPRDAVSDVFHDKYAYDLPPEDYLAVASSILEGGLFAVNDADRIRTTFWKITQAAIRFQLSGLLPQVITLLRSDDPVIQIQALMVLEHLGAEQYVKEIVKVASSPNPDVRQPAVSILLKSNSKEAVPVLISCLNDGNFGTQMRAVEALGRIGDRSAVAPLLPLLKTKTAPSVIRALVRLDAREAVPYIKELYKPGDASEEYVLTSLVYFGDEQAISQLMPEMTDANQEAGWMLLESLIRVKARAVIPALISALENEKALGGQAYRGPNIVGYVMVALARLEARESVPVLRRYLNLAFDRNLREPNGFFASRAIEALGMLKAREAVPELLQILDFRDAWFRKSAQIALARIGEPNTAQNVIASLKKHMSSSNHVEVLEELANISDPNTYRALSQMELANIEAAPSEGYLKQLTDKSGVKFTFSEEKPLPAEKRRQGIAALSSPTGLSALRRVVGTLNYSAADYAIFIHDRVVYVVTVGEVYELWDRWLAEHAKNHPVPAS